MLEQKASLKKIVSFMEDENDWVKTFEVMSTGLYEPEDAIWNYKDAPHLNCIHSLAMGCQALTSDNHVAAIHTQKIMGIKLPMTLVEYQYVPNELIYFSTLLFFTLLVNTKVNKEQDKTFVKTKYYVAGPWFTKPFFYLIRRLILKNYKILMSEDLPMRDRKANLRQLGYTFSHDKTEHSWINSTKIYSNNVVPPIGSVNIKIDLLNETILDGEYLFGNSAIHGIRVIKKSQNITLYPRLCMHEGACLDGQKVLANGLMKCPWHGRNIQPIAYFSLDSIEVISTDHKFKISKNSNIINIEIGL